MKELVLQNAFLLASSRRTVSKTVFFLESPTSPSLGEVLASECGVHENPSTRNLH